MYSRTIFYMASVWRVLTGFHWTGAMMHLMNLVEEETENKQRHKWMFMN